MWKGDPHRGRSKSVVRKRKNTRGKSTVQCPNKVQFGSIEIEPIDPAINVGGASSSRCDPPSINVPVQNIEKTMGIDKGKKVLESEFPILGDRFNIGVETKGFPLIINEEAKNMPNEGNSKNKNKKEKMKKNKKE